MSDNRLTKAIFMYDYKMAATRRYSNWSSHIKMIMDKYYPNGNKFQNMEKIELDSLRELQASQFSEIWKQNAQNKPKLRIYNTFKTEFHTEHYININLDRSERSLMAQLRTGILPLQVEIGRYKSSDGNKINLKDRVCKLCKSDSVEDEEHFIFCCTAYNDVRNNFLKSIKMKYTDFFTFSIEDKWDILFNKQTRSFAKYIKEIFLLRKDKLYVKN